MLATVDLFANWGERTRFGVTDRGTCATNTNFTPGEPIAPIVFTGVPGEAMVVTVCATNEWGDAAPVTRQISVGGT